MSAPAFAWALERGAALGLTPAARLVLIYLADMANGERVCWPGQHRIMEYTGLSLRTVRTTLRSLSEQQLIRVEASPGRLPRYHILRPTPANEHRVAPANQHRVTPANGAQPRQNSTPYPGKICTGPRQNLHLTPANQHTDPSKTQVIDPRARVRARGSEDLSSRNGKGTPQPAPKLVATPDCGQQPAADPPPVTDAEMAAKLEALAANVARRWQTNYPPRLSSLTPSEQADVVRGKDRYQARPIPPEQLAAMRRIANIGAPVAVHA